jgi:hypothetical protein
MVAGFWFKVSVCETRLDCLRALVGKGGGETESVPHRIECIGHADRYLQIQYYWGYASTACNYDWPDRKRWIVSLVR